MHAEQVFLATLTLGCSRRVDAQNYLVAPDVEVCCVWGDEVRSAGPYGDTARVNLTLDINASAMMRRVPFQNEEQQASGSAFCRTSPRRPLRVPSVCGACPRPC